MSRIAVAYTGMLMKGRRVLARWVPREALSHIPGGARTVTGILRLLRQYVIPARTEWVQVQQGFAKGSGLRSISHAKEHGGRALMNRQYRRCCNNSYAKSWFCTTSRHIGFFALPAARLGAQVITFEPDPESAARLRAHITRNHLGQKIRPVEAACGRSRFRRSYSTEVYPARKAASLPLNTSL